MKNIELFIAIIVIAGVVVFATVLLFSSQPEEAAPAIELKEDKSVQKGTGQENQEWVLNQAKLFEQDEAGVNALLAELASRFPDPNERLRALTILRLGTPYQLGCLGEEKGRDIDPIFRLDQTDCTAFILTQAALLSSQTLTQAKAMMQKINYRPNQEISFISRLHFTTDRNDVSPCFQDITEEISETVQQKTVVLNKKNNGKRLLDINWQKEIEISFISIKHINESLLAQLPQVAGAAFLKQGDEAIGLDVRHEGLILNKKDFVRASSLEGKVVSGDLLTDYLPLVQDKYQGILFYKILPCGL